MSSMKIVFVTPDRQIVIYGQGLRQLWQVESYVLEHLGEVLSQMQQEVQRANIRKYWIDDEGDQVEILNDVDYEFFLKRMGSHRTPKIYFETVAKPATPEQGEQQSRQSPLNTENMSVHQTVSCDVCQVCPIVGFRYKCLECDNYDLCMKCEGEMKHKDHIMLRLPTYGSSAASAGCPAAILFGNRRRQKKYAAACAAAAAAGATGEGGQAEGKPRHFRHHRRHCGSGGGGTGVQHILTNFYDMMQGLAEGGSLPQTASAPESPEKTPGSPSGCPMNVAAAEAAAAAVAAATKATQAANAAAAAAAAGPSTSNTQSKETNTSPDRSANAAPSGQEFKAGSASAPPSFENLQNFIDPQFMKAGIQILNNFSEMFGKILDPAVTTDATRPGSTASSVAADIDLTGNDSRPSVSPQAGTPNKASTVASGNVTPMEAEATSPHTPSSSPRAEENDWTMIDNSVPGVVLPDAVTSSSSTDPATIAAAVASASQPLDFAKLSQQLQSHIENERNTPVPVVPTPAPVSVAPAVITLPAVTPIPLPPPITVQTQTQTPAPTQASVPTPAPTPVPVAAPQPTERRAVAVYHPDQRINTAIHAMMAMGFSNEGAMLTQLLESVNGDIPLALDLMTNVQRT